MDQAEISRYELGYLAPSDEALRRLAKVARIDWLLVVHLRRFYSALLAWEARRSAAPAGRPLDLAILEPALLAVTPYRIEPRTSALAGPSAEEESREAAKIWEALERHPIGFRRRLIELSPHSASWALAVQALRGEPEVGGPRRRGDAGAGGAGSVHRRAGGRERGLALAPRRLLLGAHRQRPAGRQ